MKSSTRVLFSCRASSYLHLLFAHFPFSSALVQREMPRTTRQKAAINRLTPKRNDFPLPSFQPSGHGAKEMEERKMGERKMSIRAIRVIRGFLPFS
jgi:hypothetical protein